MDRVCIPDAPLSRFIGCLWLQEMGARPHPMEQVLPDGSVEVVLNLTGEPLAAPAQGTTMLTPLSDALVYGPHTRPFLIDTSRSQCILAVHFRPGGAYPFLGLPLDALRDQVLPLEWLWGDDLHRLRDALARARSVEARFALLETTLLARLRRAATTHPAVGYALQALALAEGDRVGAVVEQVGLSPRRLSLLFQREVGLTPKAFQRVQRFQRALDHLCCVSQVRWAELALDCGYYDQAHFVHDFKAFSGLTPAAYQALEGKRPGHVPFSP